MDRDYQQSTRRVRKQAAKTLDKMPWIAGGLLGLLAAAEGGDQGEGEKMLAHRRSCAVVNRRA